MNSIKDKILTIATIVFFLIINTSYFWVEIIGFFAFMILYYLLKFIYFVLLIIFILQLNFAIKEKFKNKFRIFNMALLAIVLILTLLFPFGIINFGNLKNNDDSEYVLIIHSVGGGNCNSTIKFKEDLTFIKRDVCFGVEKTKGTYQISNDTIYFLKGKNNVEFEFAVLKENESSAKFSYSLHCFRDKNDTIGYWGYHIYKNDLKINYNKNNEHADNEPK